MKGYSGASKSGNFGALCVAENIKEARKLLWGNIDVRDACEWDLHNLRVKRYPDVDTYALFLGVGIVRDDAILDALGFAKEC